MSALVLKALISLSIIGSLFVLATLSVCRCLLLRVLIVSVIPLLVSIISISVTDMCEFSPVSSTVRGRLPVAPLVVTIHEVTIDGFVTLHGPFKGSELVDAINEVLRSRGWNRKFCRVTLYGKL